MGEAYGSFDPYHVWLGIPPSSRPVTYYLLLGIAPGEQNVKVIESAALRQSGFIRSFQRGEHGESASRLLLEIAEARAVLLDPRRRRDYDNSLSPSSTSAQKPADRPSSTHSPSNRGPVDRTPSGLSKDKPLPNRIPADRIPVDMSNEKATSSAKARPYRIEAAPAESRESYAIAPAAQPETRQLTSVRRKSKRPRLGKGVVKVAAFFALCVGIGVTIGGGIYALKWVKGRVDTARTERQAERDPPGDPKNAGADIRTQQAAAQDSGPLPKVVRQNTDHIRSRVQLKDGGESWTIFNPRNEIEREELLNEAIAILQDKQSRYRNAALHSLQKCDLSKHKDEIIGLVKPYANDKLSGGFAVSALIQADKKIACDILLDLIADSGEKADYQVVESLGATEDSRAIPILGLMLKSPRNRHAAERAIVKFGSSAEEEVLKLVTIDRSNDMDRGGLIRLLEGIGTEKSLEKLEGIANDLHADNRNLEDAKRAIKAIQSRVELKSKIEAAKKSKN